MERKPENDQYFTSQVIIPHKRVSWYLLLQLNIHLFFTNTFKSWLLFTLLVTLHHKRHTVLIGKEPVTHF